MSTKQAFTVVLLYPDYATGDFGADVYVASAMASTPKSAAKKVQKMAHADNKHILRHDFRPILVLEGDVVVAASALDF